ncbi:predicted protein [Lichtheimia corymbifera JMRC:FSU:9682]|uniref:F-box domain-containing protein n=1 Tax=Lichtheimia corymbifera JMRC:FSU:9682 TaxID=1263082 RepID=A0A068RN58_9FUNG|nr:predicted protein [Lichtheimia corymbifera JMRC:FSU:9682]
MAFSSNAPFKLKKDKSWCIITPGRPFISLPFNITRSPSSTQQHSLFMPYPNIVFSSGRSNNNTSSCILPLEIIFNIIHHIDDKPTLKEISLVCTQLCQAALEQLWRRLRITHTAAFDHFQRSPCIKDWIQHLDIDTVSCLTPSVLQIPCRLQSLRIQQVEEIAIDPLSLTHAKALTTIELISCSSRIVNNVILHHLPAQLARLVLHDCPAVTDRHVICVADACSQLLSLVITGNSSSLISDEGLTAIINANQHLQEIVVIPPRTIVQLNTITSVTIDAILAHCSNLRLFVCPNQSRIANTSTMDRLKSHCRLLELCDLRHPLIPDSPYYEKH